MSRNKLSSKRDAGQFVALPYVVIKSAAYRSLNSYARALLIDIAIQYNSRNNGKLVACMKYLRPLGWKSSDTVSMAKRQLLGSGLLIETRKGRFPNTPAWYMLAWHDIDVSEGLDCAPDHYRRIRRGYLPAPAPSPKPAGLQPVPSALRPTPPIAPRDGAIALETKVQRPTLLEVNP